MSEGRQRTSEVVGATPPGDIVSRKLFDWGLGLFVVSPSTIGTGGQEEINWLRKQREQITILQQPDDSLGVETTEEAVSTASKPRDCAHGGAAGIHGVAPVHPISAVIRPVRGASCLNVLSMRPPSL